MTTAAFVRCLLPVKRKRRPGKLPDGVPNEKRKPYFAT